MNIKPDDKLAWVVRGSTRQNIGRIVEVLALAPYGVFECKGIIYDAATKPSWIVKAVGSPLVSIREFDERACLVTHRPYDDDCLKPIRDQPGNEQFVVEARKSLPRPATAKGDTITERGELA